MLLLGSYNYPLAHMCSLEMLSVGARDKVKNRYVSTIVVTQAG